MNSRAAINAYANVGLGTDIMSADPHKLTSMLFEGALLAIARARHALARNEPATKGQFISKAIAIIGEGLHASLDKDVGGELARNLSALYDYMVKRLVHANIKNDDAALDEVARLLTELKDAWDSIRPQVTQAVPAAGQRPGYARA
ncbi:MAG: flagellar export chaperone FliS [Rhodocyclaceae bacterium]|jgi:flagellar protein FliS|nr:flagellar export chaperone FliS [Rhodocyclaceae bacterium]MBK6553880.1 flagellar export chaperone FliS [Rhodocyclaceae bacterium]MBK6678164.1 flagellar export chaperone FliS [Rhodocyclaceae bacterium]MBK9310842.1 flagellar export chaperone FliS [Rhodocyclaceae bacterium]MBK9954087.1 flagellar export chaperone FliS [Rhodocyclaceae bacterium]